MTAAKPLPTTETAPSDRGASASIHALTPARSRSDLIQRQVPSSTATGTYQRVEAQVNELKLRGSVRREVLATAKRVDVVGAITRQASADLLATQQEVDANLVDGLRDM